MHRLRFAAATRCWRGPLTETLRTVAAAGVTGVQFDLAGELSPASLSETGRRDFLHQVRELGLSVASAVVPLRQPLFVQHELEHRLEALRAAMRFAFQLRCPTVCLRCGRIPDKPDSPDAQLLKEVLTDLARHANHIGVTLAITPSGDAAATLAALLNGIQTGPIGVDFDPAQFAMQGQSTVAELRALHRLVMHVQLRDGVRDFSGGGTETAVGQGSVDWIELFALLGEMDYSGWLTAIRTQGEDNARDVLHALKSAQRLLLGG
ncbi:MAG: sugar phosphate isomerase/epimerase [Planctomycetaceae bacterium]|nr:sugar phosphate isomerase/epimerase [Planctomycetaceae bacterium]